MYLSTTLFRTFLLTILFVISLGTAQAQTPTLISANESTSIESLTAQIAELLDLVASLQAQINAINGVSALSFPELKRNLAIGDEGQDVVHLQRLLNSIPETVVAKQGLGSVGQESTFFGNLTEDAVKRFQELYTTEILTPVGLSKGSGFVGPSTRAKINSLAKSANTAVSQNTADTSVEPTTSTVTEQSENTVVPELESADIDPSAPIIYSITPSLGALGTKVTIRGKNFSPTDNTVNFGFGMGQVTGILSTDGETLEFLANVDPELQASPSGMGEWPLYLNIINENGSTQETGLFVIRI